MFAKTIIDSDAFLDMPLSSQALYFHLNMRADDEGFINNPKKIQRMMGASDDDLKLLIAKNFIIPFESGIVVVKHWRIHNYIRGDRLHQTKYTEERALLSVKENMSYTLCQSDVSQLSGTLDTEVRLGKVSIGKDSKKEDIDKSISKKESRFTAPSVEEVRAYCLERKNTVDAETFVDFYTMKGWKVGKESMQDWKAAVRTWERNRQTPQEPPKPKPLKGHIEKRINEYGEEREVWVNDE
jgi:hypothetical protein